MSGASRTSVLETNEDFLEALYLIGLGRPLDEEWRKIRLRHLELGQSREAMIQATFGSMEFRSRYHGYHEVSDLDVIVPGEENLDALLKTLGTTDAFVQIGRAHV